MPMVSVLPSPNELAIGLYLGVNGNMMNGAQEFDQHFSADIMAAIEDIATLNGNGITKGFMKAIKTYGKISKFAIPDEKTILYNVKVHLPELLMEIAKLKKDVFSKNYLAAA